jgi:hypothetical protein
MITILHINNRSFFGETSRNRIIFLEDSTQNDDLHGLDCVGFLYPDPHDLAANTNAANPSHLNTKLEALNFAAPRQHEVPSHRPISNIRLF